MSTPPGKDRAGWPRGFAEHRASQAGIGLSMTPAERLRWLEETMATLMRWQGRARGGAIRASKQARQEDDRRLRPLG